MDEISPGDLLFSEATTSLSPSVHTLVTELTYSDHRHPATLDDDGFLDFQSICAELPDMDAGDTATYFRDAVCAMAPMLHAVEEYVGQHCVDELLVIYRDMFCWTGQGHLLVDIWQLMDNNDDVDDLAVVLVVTAVLERALGDVYLLTGAPPCPSMLRDLLLTPELCHTLGPHVVQVLRVIIGPPISLNLRNVAWHGFLVPGELPRRCVWFLLLLIPSIGKVLHDGNISVVDHRVPVQLVDIGSISDVQLAMCDCDDIWGQVTSTRMISWNTVRFWARVRDHFSQARFGVCAALLLVYLEQGLRRVFAAVNQCQHRVLTAESTTLFTTFDEILSPVMPDNSANRLRSAIGDPILEILLDVLQYQDGPRVRDRLGHGEVDWSTFPPQLAGRLVLIAVQLAAIFVPKGRHAEVDILQRIQGDIASYKVQFHRIAIIKTQIDECMSQSVNADTEIHMLPDLSPREPGVIYPVMESHHVLESIMEQIADMVASQWTSLSGAGNSFSLAYHRRSELCQTVVDVLSVKIPTLYRGVTTQPDAGGDTYPDREAEILSLVHHVTMEVSTVIMQLKQFIRTREQQLTDKVLRSRQRDNLKKFFNNFPSYIASCNLLMVLVTWQLYHLDDVPTLTDNAARIRIRFWKTSLQFCENLRTFTHVDRNKWTDGLELIFQFIRNLQSNVYKQLLYHETS